MITRKHPEQLQEKKQSSNRTTFCWAYPSDLEQFYAFYCARYENISYNDFLHLGLTEALMKLNSIPDSEPLYKVIKSRTINLSKIKDKSERKYWAELKKINSAVNAFYIALSGNFASYRRRSQSFGIHFRLSYSTD